MIEWWMVLTAYGTAIFLFFSAFLRMDMTAVINVGISAMCAFTGTVLLIIKLLQ